MMNWWIVIDLQTPDEWRTIGDPNAMTLATWEGDVAGIRWLEQLTQDAKAVKLLNDGQPNLYTVRASDVLPVLDQLLPKGDWANSVIVYADRCAACPPDQLLTIEAWDLSSAR